MSLSARRHLAAAPAAPASEADLAVTVNRPRRHTPPSRRMLDESVEHDVAGECLASIAAEVGTPHASSSRMAISSSSIRASMERSLATSYTMPPPSAQPASGSRLPAVTSPPFVRTTTAPRGGASVPGVRESTPPPSAFLRRSTPGLGVAPSYPATSSLTGSSSSAPMATASSVAPVALSPQAEPTVIVVRERPKAAWAIASAAIGAVCAVIAMQLVTSDDRAAGPAAASQAVATTTIATATLPAPPPVTATAAPAVPAAPAAPAVSATPATPATPAPLATAASPATTAAAAAAATGAVVKFGEDQGVAIKAVPAGSASAKATGAHAPAGSARPAGKPSARPTLGPSLPDGSIGLGGGRADGKGATSGQAAPGSNAASSAAATPPAPAPEPPKKRVLTPEQQVAEAQLKASMK